MDHRTEEFSGKVNGRGKPRRSDIFADRAYGKSGVGGPEPHFHRDQEYLQIAIESEVDIAIEMDHSDCNAQSPMSNAALFGQNTAIVQRSDSLTVVKSAWNIHIGFAIQAMQIVFAFFAEFTEPSINKSASWRHRHVQVQ